MTSAPEPCWVLEPASPWARSLDEPIPPGFYVKSRIHDPFDGTTKNLIAKKPRWRFG